MINNIKTGKFKTGSIKNSNTKKNIPNNAPTILAFFRPIDCGNVFIDLSSQ